MSRVEIGLATKIVRSGGVLESEVDGEVIALDIEQGQCYGFNTVASAIWNRLATETSVSEVCDSLLGEFDVQRDQCEREVLAAVQELHEEGLVKIVS